MSVLTRHAPRLPAPILSRRIWPARIRPFHASASDRIIDLPYDLHDDGGKAKGAPILILHGLFGNKKNNRSISKYAAPFLTPYNLRLQRTTNTPKQSPIPRPLPPHLRRRPPQPRRLGSPQSPRLQRPSRRHGSLPPEAQSQRRDADRALDGRKDRHDNGAAQPLLLRQHHRRGQRPRRRRAGERLPALRRGHAQSERRAGQEPERGR